MTVLYCTPYDLVSKPIGLPETPIYNTNRFEVPDLAASARSGLYEIMIVTARVAIDNVVSIIRTPL
jgi:hypothetical protein